MNTNFQVLNVETKKVEVFETKRAVAEFIAEAQGLSSKTVEKKIKAAVENGEVLYEKFQINEEEVEMTNEAVATEVKNEEVVYDAPDLDQEVADEANATHETGIDKEELQDGASELTDDEKQAVEDELAENEADQAADELESPEAEAAAEAENKDAEDKVNAEKEEKQNKRRVGKGIVAFKNGEEYQTFPSIKACATHFKELLNLQHMPFTPIMKSVRQDVDWNEYSFKHENEADLHIPESLKKKLEDSKKAAETADAPTTDEKAEMKETAEETQQQDEIIEEITEEELA